MKRTLIDKVNMFTAVYAVLKNNMAIWQSLVKFTAVVNLFKTNNDKIAEIGTETASSTTGVTSDKNVVKQNMLDSAFVIAGKGFWYADDIASDALKNKFKMIKVENDAYSDVEAFEICNVVLITATEQLANLADYGVAQPDLDNLSDLIFNFNTSIDTKVVVKVDHKVDLGALETVIKQNSEIIKNKLTPAMRQFKATENDFYKAYLSAKKVNASGGGKKKNFKLDLAVNEIKTALHHDFVANTIIHVKNTGLTNVRFFLSTAAGLMDSGAFVEVLAGQTLDINVNDFMCDLLTHKYLVVVNLSGTENGKCEGKVF